MKGVTLPTETVFVMENSPIKFGLGAMDEVGFDASRLGIRKALIFTDRHISELGLAERVRALPRSARASSWLTRRSGGGTPTPSFRGIAQR